MTGTPYRGLWLFPLPPSPNYHAIPAKLKHFSHIPATPKHFHRCIEVHCELSFVHHYCHHGWHLFYGG